jgi:hypothetical protein
VIDPTGTLVREIRAYPAVAAITARIRTVEPAADDIRGGGTGDPYVPFVVISRAGAPRERRVGVQRARYGVRAYGTTPTQATALYGAVSDAIHNAGPRIHAATGVLVFRSYDDTGGTADRDPNTQQPLEQGFVDYIAATVPPVPIA